MKILFVLFLALSLMVAKSQTSNLDCKLVNDMVKKLSVEKGTKYMLSDLNAGYLQKELEEKVGPLQGKYSIHEDDKPPKVDSITLCNRKCAVYNVNVNYAIKYSEEKIFYFRGKDVVNEAMYRSIMVSWAMQEMRDDAIKDSLAGDYTIEHIKVVKDKFVLKKSQDGNYIAQQHYKACIDELDNMIKMKELKQIGKK